MTHIINDDIKDGDDSGEIKQLFVHMIMLTNN